MPTKVWDDRGPGHLRFGSSGGSNGTMRDSKSLGFISEHGVLHSALFERVQELDAIGWVDLSCPAQVLCGTEHGVDSTWYIHVG